MFKRRRKK